MSELLFSRDHLRVGILPSPPGRGAGGEGFVASKRSLDSPSKRGHGGVNPTLRLLTTLALSIVAAFAHATNSTVAIKAQRVVSLAPHITELVESVGGEHRLVGATTACKPRRKDVKAVASYSGIDFEQLIALKPDLVIVWPSGNRVGDLEKLRQLSSALGFQVLSSEPKQLDDIATDIRRVADSLDLSEPEKINAQRAIASFNHEMHTLRVRYQRASKVDVYYQLGGLSLQTLNGSHIVSEAIALCGGRNVFAGLPMIAPLVDREAVLAAKPQVMLLAEGSQLTEFKRFWAPLLAIPAVRYGRLYAADGDRLHRPSPGIINGIEALCKAIQER